jgi:hypothetical protein
MDFNDQEKEMLIFAFALLDERWESDPRRVSVMKLRDKVLDAVAPDSKLHWVIESQTKARRSIDGAVIRPYATMQDSLIGFAVMWTGVGALSGKTFTTCEPLESGTLTAAMAECDKRWPA